MSRFQRRTSYVFAMMVVLLFGGFLTAPAQAQTAKADDVLIVRDLPAKVRLVPGERVRITLPTNLTTGYTWIASGGCCAAGDKPVVKISKGTYRAPENPQGLVGVPGETTWTVRALRPGRTNVTIVTRPPGVENTMQDETVGILRIIVRK